ncbi:MAG TPA: hypothetical protein VFA18_02355, partial [Gemmataceae bacterium]|nr:hypothetical protein [Gemmataceae bacterium]
MKSWQPACMMVRTPPMMGADRPAVKDGLEFGTILVTLIPLRDSVPMESSNNKRLFVACFIALIATAFGFIIRTMVIDEWAMQFNLSATERGEILGVGLWPFALSIVLFSLVIDRIGYGRAIAFAFVCHVASAIIAMCAPNVQGEFAHHSAAYWMLYLGNFVVALGNGTVEAVINPVVATMFSRDKTKWLNILHAGWPGGLVLGGILTIGLSTLAAKIGTPAHTGIDSWRFKVGLIFIPTILYGLLMLGRQFPVNERVEAGVPYRAMLQEAGTLGAMIVLAIIMAQVSAVFGGDWYWYVAAWAALVLAYGAYVQALGRIMFIFLLLVMIPLATTELGVDSWSTDLMGPEMTKLGYNAGWVLVY